MRYTASNILLSAAVALSMAACTDELEGGRTMPVVGGSSDAICFVTSGNIGASAEPATRRAGYVDETVEEWEIVGQPESAGDTRATIGTDLYSQFNPAGMRIFVYDSWTDSSAPNMQVPQKDQLSAVPALPCSFSSDGVLSPLDPLTYLPYTILWKETKDEYKKQKEGSDGNFAMFRAYALAPLETINQLCHDGTEDENDDKVGAHMQYDPGDIGTPPSIVYTTPDNPKDQKDVIAAYTGELALDDNVYGKQVPLTFYHTLAAVQFKVGFACRVKSLTITGIYRKGKCDIGENGSQTWNFEDYKDEAGTYSYTWPFNGSGSGYTEYEDDGNGNVTTEDGGYLTRGDQTLLMIPQTLPADAKVILEYQPAGGGDTKVITCDIGKFQWKPGRRYVYTIKEEPTFDIYFDLAAGNIVVNATTYTGYVYVAGTVTTVTGAHSASNKYYVYQSTGTTTGDYDGYHTGYLTADDWNGGSPAVAPTIPNYPEITVDGKSWAEYITGNFDREAVRTTFDTEAAKCGRTRTNNYFAFITPDADVTIDNVCGTRMNGSKHGDYMTPMYRAGNLKLKGDNRLLPLGLYGNVLTSYYGDGSRKGTLVLMYFDNKGRSYNHMYLRSMQSPNNYSIKGGTIYVATSTKYEDSYQGTYGGACVLADPGQTFNMVDGVLTAAAWGNMAAIGGQATATAAISSTPSYLNFYGGEVYAYAGGVYQPRCSKMNFYLGNTAIGGGSSIMRNAGNTVINICGDAYIEATSKGGTAIGGGSSGTAKGGGATVNIYGNSKVFANSVSGLIESSNSGYASISIEAGSSIGGGTGGLKTSSNTENGRKPAQDNIGHGGDAVVNVYGNAKLIAGSVGGGARGTLANGQPALVGNATISISENCDIQMQAVMANTGGSSLPSFTMDGGLLHLVDESYSFSKPDGGAVWMDSGTCDISGGTISGFKAQNGGAVYMESGTFIMNGGIIQNCRALYDSSADTSGNGGAVYINDATGAATVNITGGTITNNYADWNGGAVYLEGGNVNMSGGTLTGNKALDASGDYGNGGGIYLMKGNYTMTGGTISGNMANGNGGGVYISSPETSGNDITVDIRQGTITRNSSERFGAGLYVKPGGSNSATVNIGISGETSNTDPEITWNSASLRGGGIYGEGRATINLNEGKVKNNSVSAYVYNQDIANQGGEVTLALNSTTGLPISDLYYITITFDPAGGNFTDGNTAGTSSKTYLVKSTDSKLNIPTPKRRNFTFKGWVPSQGEADTGHADSEYDNATGGSMTFNYDKDITLTATWQANY